jgi:hypothetical protein
MSEPVFEPMSVGGVLDQAFRLYRENFVRFLAIVAIIQVPLYLLLMVWAVAMQAGMVRVQEEGTAEEAQAIVLGISMIGLLLYVPLTVVGQQLTTAALVKSISESYLGREASVGQSYRFVLPKALSLIGAALLVALIAGVGYLLCVVPGVIFALWFSLTAPSIVIENRGATAGMSRSKDLVSGNLGRVFLVFLIVFLISAAFSFVFGAAGQFLAMTVLADKRLALVAIQQLLEMIPAILVMPIGAAASVLLYYDLRIRKEGFDLELLAERLGAAEAPASDAPAV